MKLKTPLLAVITSLGQLHDGVSWLEDVEAESANLSFEPGWAVSGALGYERPQFLHRFSESG